MFFMVPNSKLSFCLIVKLFQTLSNIPSLEMIAKIHVGSLISGTNWGLWVNRWDWTARPVRLIGQVQVDLKHCSISLTKTQKVNEFSFFLSNTIWSLHAGLLMHLFRFNWMLSSWSSIQIQSNHNAHLLVRIIFYMWINSMQFALSKRFNSFHI